MSNLDKSVLDYYRNHAFNPVLIPVEQPAIWTDHVAKRAHLYERHLGLPIAFLRDRRVLEFGPNSGENALVLALAGAHLTLVEPNEQVHQRLFDLFRRFDVSEQLEEVAHAGVDEFVSDRPFDLVIAEGFLYTLPNRDHVLRKLLRQVSPGGFLVISVNDRFGGMIEMIRRAVLFRACHLAGVKDPHSDECFSLARFLYEDDFKRLPASRTFHSWWKDTLVNPFYCAEYLWSVPEILPIVADEGCDFHSTSPTWATFEHGNWYKNVPQAKGRAETALSDWKANLRFFVTGVRSAAGGRVSASDDVVKATADFVGQLSEMRRGMAWSNTPPEYPRAIDAYLRTDTNPTVRQANEQLRSLTRSLNDAESADSLVSAYHGLRVLRELWGVAYQYICFQRPYTSFNVKAA